MANETVEVRERTAPKTKAKPLPAMIADASESVESQTCYAVLIRGSYYDLGGKVFERGKRVRVSAAERAHLVEHAKDRLINTDTDGYVEAVYLQKFRFEDEAGKEASPLKYV